jgi:hypothetical protein
MSDFVVSSPPSSMAVLNSLVAIFVVSATLLFLFHRKRRDNTIDHSIIGQFSACPNPDCIRCRRYRLVQQKAKQKWTWVKRDTHTAADKISLGRIEKAVQANGVLQSIVPYQAPTVVFIPGLRCQPVVTGWHSDTCRRMRKAGLLESIRKEVDQADDYLWGQNDTPQGSWQVLSFLNQGKWDKQVLKACPVIGHLLLSLPDCLDKCLFGNAFISKIQPNTIITPHCGPTNIRHRLQFPILTNNGSDNDDNERCGLLVAGDNLISWEEGVPFVFDDSLEHSVDYKTAASSSRSERIVLIVDLWHPDLDKNVERDVLCQLYPPFIGSR